MMDIRYNFLIQPNLMDLVDDEEEETETVKAKKKEKPQKYKPAFQNMEFFETKQEKNKREKKIENRKKVIRNDEYFNDLLDEFNDAPKEYGNFFGEEEQLQREVQDYETENFTRVKIPKRQLKEARKNDRKKMDIGAPVLNYKHFSSIANEDSHQALMEEMQYNSSKKMIGNKTKQHGFEKTTGNKQYGFEKMSGNKQHGFEKTGNKQHGFEKKNFKKQKKY
jgi:hypothetical protein